MIKKKEHFCFLQSKMFTCHNGPAFNSMNFHALGTQDMYENGGLNTGPEDVRNLGRGMFTGREEDMHRFKVPQLYNLKEYAAYFHGSSKKSLRKLLILKSKHSLKTHLYLMTNYQLHFARWI